MSEETSALPRVSGLMVLKPFLGLIAAVGCILLCVLAITKVTGPLVDGPYEWLGHTIVGLSFIGILISGYIGIQCKVRFIVNLRDWIHQFFE